MPITLRKALTIAKRRVGIEKDRRDWLLQMLPKHSVCAEIGVLWGTFSGRILKIVQPSKLHLIDPWHYEADPLFAATLYGAENGKCQEFMDSMYQRVVRKLGQLPNVRIHRSPSLECVQQFPDNYFDWIYVDGDHRYEGTLKDLTVYYSKLKPGGFVTGDDYARRKTNWTQDGVTRAVDEVLTRELYEKVLIEPENHLFLLKRPM